MLPALFGVSVTQINLLLNTIWASFMQDGSVSWLYSAERMTELPLGLIGVAIGTVILPSLSARHAEQDQAKFRGMIDWAAKSHCIGRIAGKYCFIYAFNTDYSSIIPAW